MPVKLVVITYDYTAFKLRITFGRPAVFMAILEPNVGQIRTI